MTAGKGDRPRPMEIPREDFRKRWEETFGKKDKTDGQTKTTELPKDNGTATASS